MESWLTLSPAVITSLISEREIDLVNDWLGGVEGKAIGEVFAGAVSTVRSHCAAQGLDVPGTIPPETDWCLKSIYRYRVLSSLPQDDLITEAREKDYLEQMKTLRAIADGKVKITAPAVKATLPENMSGTPMRPRVSAYRPRLFDRKGLDGF